MNKFLTSAFIFGGIAASTLIGSPATHATSGPSCVDGTIRSNLSAMIVNHDTVTVTTKGSAPLCKDLTLNWDSYTMPDNYDGKPFSESKTAAPQAQYDHNAVVMKAGATSATAKLKLPECKNVQTDLYYAPEITTVTVAGHGAQFITGEINGYATSYTGSRVKDLTACQTPSAPVKPVTPEQPQTPVTSAKPVAPTAPAVTELASTGIRENVTMVMGAVLAAGAYGIAYAINKKRASQL
jgi:hypothetical protein